jgi:hypothetical protein
LKFPQLNIIEEFLTQHGHEEGGCIRTDHGGKLACSSKFQDLLLWKFHYTIKPTGADSPYQNSAAKINNNKFAVCICTLLYGSSLPAKYWSEALLHLVYLYNRLVHRKTQVIPFESYYEQKRDLSLLKVFGSRVCVKQSGDRSGKLDRNDFTGIFIGYTATDHNISYLDLDTGTVKQSHHTLLNEAWYFQSHQPLAANLLYDLGLESNNNDGPETHDHVSDAPWPPLSTGMLDHTKWMAPPLSQMTPLTLRETLTSRTWTAAAALLRAPNHDARVLAAKACLQTPSYIVTEYLIDKISMAMVYMSPDPYFEAFKEMINLHKFDLTKQRTAGLRLA